MAYKNIFIAFIIVAALGLAIITTVISYRPTVTTSAQKEQAPDAFMEDVTTLVIDKQGKPSMKIATPKLIHYANENSTHFVNPRLTLYRQSPQPWYIEANYAKALEGIDKIHFWNNVTIHHAADYNNPATLIKTTSLTVYPNQQTAETNDLITLIQPSITVKATGMQANMNTGDIKLLSQARGEYAPNP